MEPSTSSDTTSKPWCCILHVDVKQTKKQRQNVLSFGTTQWAAVQCAAQKRRSERNFEDSVYFNIVHNLPDEFPSESDNAGYHVQCYKNFTAVASSAPANKCERNVPAVSRRRSSAEPDHQPSTCTTDILQQLRPVFSHKPRRSHMIPSIQTHYFSGVFLSFRRRDKLVEEYQLCMSKVDGLAPRMTYCGKLRGHCFHICFTKISGVNIIMQSQVCGHLCCLSRPVLEPAETSVQGSPICSVQGLWQCHRSLADTTVAALKNASSGIHGALGVQFRTRTSSIDKCFRLLLSIFKTDLQIKKFVGLFRKKCLQSYVNEREICNSVDSKLSQKHNFVSIAISGGSNHKLTGLNVEASREAFDTHFVEPIGNKLSMMLDKLVQITRHTVHIWLQGGALRAKGGREEPYKMPGPEPETNSFLYSSAVMDIFTDTAAFLNYIVLNKILWDAEWAMGKFIVCTAVRVQGKVLKKIRISAFEMRCYRRLLGITWKEKYSSSSSAGESSTLMTTDDGTMYSSSTSNNDGVVLLQV
ncbi:hypothetical protein GQR58_019158 [Nymphon striatum]|nr:hypothetical protein GQR58_019158 [Nymphon striatum]